MSKKEKPTIHKRYSNKICRAVVTHMIFCIMVALDVVIYNDVSDILIFSLAFAVVDCIGFIRIYSKMQWAHQALQDIYTNKSNPVQVRHSQVFQDVYNDESKVMWYKIIAKDALFEMDTKDLY